MSDDDQAHPAPHDVRGDVPGETRLSEAELEALPSYDPDNPVDRADVMGEAGRWLAGWAGRFLLVAAGLVVLGLGLRYLSVAIMPVLLALLVTSVLYPVTALLRRWGVPYGLGAALSLLLGIGIIAGLIGLIAPAVAHQWDDLRNQSLDGIRRIQEWMAGPPLNINDEQIAHYISQAVAWLQDRSGDIASSLVTISGSVGSGLVALVATLFITFFMLKDGHKFIGWLRRIVGRRTGFHASELLTRIWNTLSGYLRTQAIVSFVDAVFIGIGIALLGVPLAFPIAVLTFMAGFIPIVGAFTAGTIAVLVALVSNGLTTALLVLAVVLAVQQLEGHILQPLLQSRVMDLHPVVVLLAVILGSTWAGIVGAFLAVPVAAVGAVLLRYLGNLTDLRTGDKTASDIAWVTDDGRTVATESEASALFYRALVRVRLARKASGPQLGDDEETGAWRRLFRGRQVTEEDPHRGENEGSENRRD